MLDRKLFTEAMATLCEVFQRQPTDLLLEAYYLILKEMTSEDFRQAIVKVLQNKTFSKLPLPAEILNCFQDDMQTKAQLALAKLEKMVDTYGTNYSIEFGDPVIHAVVVRLGGWEWITTQQRDEWKWIRKDFEKLYGIYSKLNPAQIDAPERLVGRFEANCSITGEDFEEINRRHGMLVKIDDSGQMSIARNVLSAALSGEIACPGMNSAADVPSSPNCLSIG